MKTNVKQNSETAFLIQELQKPKSKRHVFSSSLKSNPYVKTIHISVIQKYMNTKENGSGVFDGQHCSRVGLV